MQFSVLSSRFSDKPNVARGRIRSTLLVMKWMNGRSLRTENWLPVLLVFSALLACSAVNGFAQQTNTTTLAPVKTKLLLLTQQTCAAVAGVANQSLICYDVSGAIEENVNNTGWVPFVGGACSNCVVTDGSGNATIAGDFTALELILSGSGPLDVTTPCNTVSAPPGGFGLLGMGTGCVPVIYPTALGSQVPIAYQDGSGNVAQNALTATNPQNTPAICAGNYALGVTTTGFNAQCDTSTYVLIPCLSSSLPTGVSGFLSMYCDATVTPNVVRYRVGTTLQTPLVKSTTYSAWTCPIATATPISATQFCNWTLPVGITVVGFDLAVDNTSVCSTNPVVQVWDASVPAEVGSFSITMDGSTSFYTQVTGISPVVTTHQLRVKVTTPGVCSTAPAAIVATVTYQMS